MLPSIAIADITDEDAGKEIIVPQPAATDGGDSQLWVYTLDGGYAKTGIQLIHWTQGETWMQLPQLAM